MTQNLPAVSDAIEQKMLVLAREIAMDILDIEIILNNNQIDPDLWETIKKHPRFEAILSNELREWQGALNTGERVKLKAAAMVEQALPELYARMVNPKESLAATTELFKAVSRLAGMGVSAADISGGSDRFQLTIKIGNDQPVAITSEVTRTIEHEAAE